MNILNKSEEKLVSVIIPTYSRTKYIKRAIDSVLNQTYKNIEIIVVDDNGDGSKYQNKMKEIMSEYSKFENIKYIRHKINLNGSAARNTGIKNSNGDYICFLDDDDYYLKDRIMKSVDLLEKNNEYDGIYTNVARIKNNNIVGIVETKGNGVFLKEILSQKGLLGTGSNLFFTKKSIKETGKFDESFFRHQDLEYMARFFERYKIMECREILVVKCQDDRNNELNICNSINTREQFLKKFKYLIDQSVDKDYIYFSNYFSLAINCLYQKKYKLYYNMISKAKKYKKLLFADKIKIVFGFFNGYIKIINLMEYIKNRSKIKNISCSIKNQICEYECNYE